MYRLSALASRRPVFLGQAFFAVFLTWSGSMMRIKPAASIRAIFLSAILLSSEAGFSAHRVYVLHGYMSAPVFMRGMANILEKQGFHVVNWGYDSFRPLADEGGRLRREIALSLASSDSVSFVTHSTGAVVVRLMLDSAAHAADFPRIYRIVMVAPPSRGADLADPFARNPVTRWILGPNITALCTDSASLTNRLPRVYDEEIGIIAGALECTGGYNPWIKGPNDGYISVAHMRLGSEKDFIITPAFHAFSALDGTVQELTAAFLKNGKFDIRR
jgi:hypothetical protein